MARFSFPKIKMPASLSRRLSALSRPVQIALMAAGSVILAVLLIFTVDRATNGGEVLGTVVVDGVDIGGLSERDAVARLQEFEEQLRNSPMPVSVADQSFSLDPKAIAFDLDEQAIVSNAMKNGRSGNILGQFGWWLTHWGASDVIVTPEYGFDEARLESILAEWEIDGIDRPAYPGDVRVEGNAIVFEYPATGTGIDQASAISAITAALADPTRPTIGLQTRIIDPVLTDSDIDAAAAEASALVEDDVTLSNDEIGTQVILPRDLLTSALVITRVDSGDTQRFEMSLDEATIAAYVAGFAPYLETPATDAEIVIDVETDEVSIVPSLPFREPDPDLLVDAVWNAMQTPERSGDLVYRDGREADFSTADAEALGIKELIGEFTTFHPCCANRVINIQKIADATDGALVMPGEVFSLNDHVGKRTVEKGYVCAGALLGNELVEEGEICIGGGTSQFTTTLYNAAFFAGLEDISHTPHSIWFSRYPEGREATLGFRDPELIFRNNTQHAFIIKTTHTDTSITAKIYGDNGDIDVEAGLSGRYGHTGIVKKYRVNPELAAPYCTQETAKKVQAGSPGWSVTVYRYITYPDGTKTTESWGHRYQGAWEIWEYNPSDPGCITP